MALAVVTSAPRLAIQTSVPKLVVDEDGLRIGYENLTDSGEFWGAEPTDSRPHFINARGGDDRIVMYSQSELADDIIYAGSGEDYVSAGGGEDTIYAGSGADLVLAGTGDDVVYGGTGDDVISGENGRDTLFGGAGDDTLYGSRVYNGKLDQADQAADVLDGGPGNDLLLGGVGADRMTGGEGGDYFIFTDWFEISSGLRDRDVILDFNRADGDKIDLSQIDALIDGLPGQSNPLNDSFRFSETPTTAAGRVWVDSTDAEGNQAVHLNRYGSDVGVEFTIIVHTTDGARLQANDFLL